MFHWQKGNVHPAYSSAGLPWSSNDEESACHAGDQGLIPELGKSSGEGNGNPLPYSGLENSMGREAWRLQFVGLQRVRHHWATNTHTEGLSVLGLGELGSILLCDSDDRDSVPRLSSNAYHRPWLSFLSFFGLGVDTKVYGILVLWPGIGHTPPLLEAWCLND